MDNLNNLRNILYNHTIAKTKINKLEEINP